MLYHLTVSILQIIYVIKLRQQILKPRNALPIILCQDLLRRSYRYDVAFHLPFTFQNLYVQHMFHLPKHRYQLIGTNALIVCSSPEPERQSNKVLFLAFVVRVALITSY